MDHKPLVASRRAIFSILGTLSLVVGLLSTLLFERGGNVSWRGVLLFVGAGSIGGGVVALSFASQPRDWWDVLVPGVFSTAFVAFAAPWVVLFVVYMASGGGQ